MLKILVTGANGFIGSHLTEIFVNNNYNVTALCEYNSFNSVGWLENIKKKQPKNLKIINGDIRDSIFCKHITKNIDIVYNLAALVSIPYSYISPDNFIGVNVIGTANLCQGSLENNVKHYIQISTSEVYGTAKYVPIDEGHPLQPQSPYSASKISSEVIALSYYYSFNLPVTILRPFNTYGPRQSNRAVIPTILTQIISGKKNIKLGNIRTTRDFNYVTDTCDGMHSIIKMKKSFGQTINIGSNTEASIEDVVNVISSILNAKINIIDEKTRYKPKKSEVMRLVCDNRFMKSLTNHKHKITLENGLKKTIKWFGNSDNINYMMKIIILYKFFTHNGY